MIAVSPFSTGGHISHAYSEHLGAHGSTHNPSPHEAEMTKRVSWNQDMPKFFRYLQHYS
jgi:hypothetical protein